MEDPKSGLNGQARVNHCMNNQGFGSSTARFSCRNARYNPY